MLDGRMALFKTSINIVYGSKKLSIFDVNTLFNTSINIVYGGKQLSIFDANKFFNTSINIVYGSDDESFEFYFKDIS